MQKKPITNKLLWIFAVGQFGWSLLSGIVTNWMVYYYTGSPDAQNPNTGIFASGITQNPILFKLTLFGLVLAVGRIFDAITDDLAPRGIDFTYDFEADHDRFIRLDNGWKINLGRGLDIFDKVERFSVDRISQEDRRCKACSISFVREEDQ